MQQQQKRAQMTPDASFGLIFVVAVIFFLRHGTGPGPDLARTWPDPTGPGPVRSRSRSGKNVPDLARTGPRTVYEEEQVDEEREGSIRSALIEQL